MLGDVRHCIYSILITGISQANTKTYSDETYLIPVKATKIGATLFNILYKHNIKQKENRLKYGEYYTLNNFVCTKENGELVTNDSLKYLSRIVNYELGIRYNFHSLRHTHATMDTYSHVTQKMKKDSVDIFEKILPTQK